MRLIYLSKGNIHKQQIQMINNRTERNMEIYSWDPKERPVLFFKRNH